jgi:hypothetical protein
MGKRSDFERKKLDFYQTPKEAVIPLLPHIPIGKTFCEPCAGDGVLIKHLSHGGLQCVAAYDVEPRQDWIIRHDASFLTKKNLNDADLIITNPPWDRTPLHQIIERCAALRPTWLLFDADWMHTKQAKPHLDICHVIVSVGRVKWEAGSASTGKDNCCWYLFDSKFKPNFTHFVARS